jgi:hypothetical protein
MVGRDVAGNSVEDVARICDVLKDFAGIQKEEKPVATAAGPQLATFCGDWKFRMQERRMR